MSITFYICSKLPLSFSTLATEAKQKCAGRRCKHAVLSCSQYKPQNQTNFFLHAHWERFYVLIWAARSNMPACRNFWQYCWVVSVAGPLATAMVVLMPVLVSFDSSHRNLMVCTVLTEFCSWGDPKTARMWQSGGRQSTWLLEFLFHSWKPCRSQSKKCRSVLVCKKKNCFAWYATPLLNSKTH